MSEKHSALPKKVEVKRQNVTIDMTAMCDMAFLLLTFFILTTKFKANEPIQVEIPPSRAQIPIPESGILTISVGNDGRVFMGIDDQNTRLMLLDSIAARGGFQVNGTMQKNFQHMDGFGASFAQLGQLLNMKEDDLGKVKQPGIPVGSDSTANELKEMILMARYCKQKIDGQSYVIAIKGDRNCQYEQVNKVIETLIESKINRFNFITTAKGGAALE